MNHHRHSTVHISVPNLLTFLTLLYLTLHLLFPIPLSLSLFSLPTHPSLHPFQYLPTILNNDRELTTNQLYNNNNNKQTDDIRIRPPFLPSPHTHPCLAPELPLPSTAAVPLPYRAIPPPAHQNREHTTSYIHKGPYYLSWSISISACSFFHYSIDILDKHVKKSFRFVSSFRCNGFTSHFLT